MDVSTRVRVCCGKVEMIVLYWVEMRVAPGRDIVIEIISVKVFAGWIYVSVRKKVLAGRIDVCVMDCTVVSVSLGSVTGYELTTVDAGWTDASTRVRVCRGSVDVKVL